MTSPPRSCARAPYASRGRSVIVEFKVLGPLRVRSGEVVPALGPRKQRLLLAVLLGHPHGSFSADYLVDALWGSAPPPSAAANLRLYTRGLRVMLGPDRVLREGGAGYRLDVDCAEVDVPDVPAGPPVPAQLPGSPLGFVGRDDEIDRLNEITGLLGTHGASRPSPPDGELTVSVRRGQDGRARRCRRAERRPAHTPPPPPQRSRPQEARHHPTSQRTSPPSPPEPPRSTPRYG
jgi:hypothetical protein